MNRLPEISRHTLAFILLTGLCLLLVAIRIVNIPDKRVFFLTWNLFLAWLPLLFVLLARRSHKASLPKVITLGLLALWLLFFPNSPYIITDLLHLNGHFQGPILWYDSVLFFLFALVGLLVGLYSLKIVHQTIVKMAGIKWGWVAVLSSLLLSGFGVYLGRYSRWNSWHLFSKPDQLVADILLQLQNPFALQLTLLFTTTLFLLYLAFGLLTSASQHATDFSGRRNKYKSEAD